MDDGSRPTTPLGEPAVRVIHVVTAFPRHPDDPITPWLVELVRRQRESGLDASVLAPAYRGGADDDDAPVPVERFRYAPAALETLTHDETVPDRLRRRPLQSLLVPFYLAGGMRAARRIGRTTRPDVVHVHWPMPHALLGHAMRRGSGGRTAVVCSYYSVEINWIRSRLVPLLPFLRWTARTADGLTAISRSTAAAVEELIGEGQGGAAPGADSTPVAVIPYGAALSDDVRPPARPSLAATGEDAAVRILFVGRLVERKGVEVLVRAVARGEFSRPVELRIVGSGEWEERIREAVREAGFPRAAADVLLLGRLSDEALRAEYEAADLLVLPAVRDAKGDTEGLGVVLLEALRFERPVIGSDIGGIPDIIVDGETGLLCPPGDERALAAAIRRLIDDPALARRLAAEGRRRALTRFGWRHVVDATSSAYERARAVRREARGDSAS
ncbi:MAG: glycosyltransferase family 4 protein [Gemmatimonadota bacterium]|nr:glycosyltransferase family 4 protein [Gemmatimonadota bacterium]